VGRGDYAPGAPRTKASCDIPQLASSFEGDYRRAAVAGSAAIVCCTLAACFSRRLVRSTVPAYPRNGSAMASGAAQGVVAVVSFGGAGHART